ncbi:MAG: gamma-glutamyl-gamma-aminobutyrate hydrolase family protein [Candidatus Eremiobacteraeota bacterium]|nr:gamma-glutamyl-gamma-aminobutyrate hydrolase family protein [Candidatus Eremiobacteraeota bacterium]
MVLPVIGITSPLDRADEAGYEESEAARHAALLEGLGAATVILARGDPTETALERRKIDGVLLSGGGDVAASLYGGQPDIATDRVDPLRDAGELSLLRRAFARRVPALCVCRGMQLANVAFGGTLIEDLPSRLGRRYQIKHQQVRELNVPADRTTHLVWLERGSQLREILGQERLETNSMHHQALDRLAPPLACAAHSGDGVVEAVELKARDQFLIGVQWHPESLPASAPTRRLYRAFIERAKVFAGIAGVAVALCLAGVPRAALAQIAPGVQQSAAHTATIAGTVTQSTGEPVRGADVRLDGRAVLSTRSNDRGIFSFTNVPWGTYRITVTSAFGVAASERIAISGDVNVAIAYPPPSSLKTIARVSTTGAGAHINVTSSSVASVTPSEYAFSGNSTWTNLFAQVPGVAVSGYSSGGGAFAGAMRGAPQMPVVLSLNGALPYETSTTLDGMPLQNVSSNGFIQDTGGGLDLSNLPLNAFDTADVVRGPGANAPSIVDSIGGSFVLHPPGLVSGNHFEFSTSNDPYGGIVSNARMAVRLGRLSATAIYGVNDSPGPLGNSTVVPALPGAPSTIGGKPVWAPISFENLNQSGVLNCFCSATSTLLLSGVPQSTAWVQHGGALALSYDVAPSVTAEVFTRERRHASSCSRDIFR